MVTSESGCFNQHAADSGLALQPADGVTKTPYYYALFDKQGKQVARCTAYGPQLALAGTYTMVQPPTSHGHTDIVWQTLTIPAHGIQTIPVNSGIACVPAKDVKAPYRIFARAADG